MLKITVPGPLLTFFYISTNFISCTALDPLQSLLKSSFELIYDLGNRTSRFGKSPYSTFNQLLFNQFDDIDPLSLESSKCPVINNIPKILTMNRKCEKINLTADMENAFGPGDFDFFERQGPNRCSGERKDESLRYKNVVFGMAERYSCEAIYFFIRSVRSSGSVANIIMSREGGTKGLSSQCLDLFTSCGNVTFIDSENTIALRPELRRFFLALKWITENWDSLDNSSQILLIDTRDVIFQSNPFRELSFYGADLIVTEESYPTINGLSIYSNNTVFIIISSCHHTIYQSS